MTVPKVKDLDSADGKAWARYAANCARPGGGYGAWVVSRIGFPARVVRTKAEAAQLLARADMWGEAAP